MRVWLDPRQGRRRPPAGDVVRAIQEQNLQVRPGQLERRSRARRLPDRDQRTGPLRSTEEFGTFVLKTGANARGRAPCRRGAHRSSAPATYDTQPTRHSPTAIPRRVSGAGRNSLATARCRDREMQELSKRFPPGSPGVRTTTPRSSCASRSRQSCIRCSRRSRSSCWL